eukprot:TRINITY_DN2021_c0_g3_i1.p1 TRINITY_DN2021_c0_g3~~TRINITY_DN2021_c0_g3_i1.p1  ORF type:complete len:850 (+),score=237.61 TRINITY_DN2021_c0_g3_i1:86-2635(+)
MRPALIALLLAPVVLSDEPRQGAGKGAPEPPSRLYELAAPFAIPFDNVRRFLTDDVPQLLQHAGQALRKAPWPRTWKGWTRLSTPRLLDLLAPATACMVAALIPLLLLVGDAARARRHPPPAGAPRADSFWLTRVLLIRGQAVCYLAAFLTSAFQNRALFGSLGLMPARMAAATAPRPVPALEALEWAGLPPGDWTVEVLSHFGVCLSLVMLARPVLSAALPALLWVVYLSIVNLGSQVINYGWEWLTLEAGFLCIFLCPLFSASHFPVCTPPPRLVLWLFRWLGFRLMIGAGMSKTGRGSSACWKELSCTDTHYFTQPLPNPLAWYMHFAPEFMHRAEVAAVFFEQLCLPFLMLVPLRSVRHATALLELFFQGCIIATGNYAWINFIGCVPLLAMFDDAALCGTVFSRWTGAAARSADDAAHPELPGAPPRPPPPPAGTRARAQCFISRAAVSAYRALRLCIYLYLVAVIGYKSKEPLKELFSAQPWLHYYDDYFLVNAQGVFGFINKERVTVALSYSHNASEPRLWHPLDFRSYPGSLDRMPPVHTPYHYRLDWETWIHTTASMEGRPPQGRLPPFLNTLLEKILRGDTDAAGLLAEPLGELLRGAEAPQAVRAEYYMYTFTPPGAAPQPGAVGKWWSRTPIAGERPIVRTRAGLGRSRGVRRSPPARGAIMVAAACGCAAALCVLLQSACGRRAELGGDGAPPPTVRAPLTALCAAALLLAWGGTFVSALQHDYADRDLFGVRWAGAGAGLPQLQEGRPRWMALAAYCMAPCAAALALLCGLLQRRDRGAAERAARRRPKEKQPQPPPRVSWAGYAVAAAHDFGPAVLGVAVCFWAADCCWWAERL